MARSTRRDRLTSTVVAVAVLLVGACRGDDDASPTEPDPPAVTTTGERTDTADPVIASTSPTADPVAPAAELDTALRDELQEMFVQDQAVRTGVAPPGDDRTEAELFAAMDSVDAANQVRLAEILDEHGWPGWSLVGEEGSTAAWAIVQHADLDLAFQERGLELLEQAVAAGDASPGDLAYLVDRVRVAKGEPQVYGTQWGAPIEDEGNVDARRAEVGLDTMEEYLAELEEMFGEE